MKRLAILGALTMCSLVPAAASAQARCTRETLAVSGTPVTIGYCVTAAPTANGGDELIVPVSATYEAPGGSFGRTGDLHFVAGERVSRVLESLDLAKLGRSGVLHLTLEYTDGSVRIEGALLTPGAIVIK